MHWNELANNPFDNPTKSTPVNDLIKSLKKKGVRKQGKPLQAQKPFTEQVYEAAIQKMDRHDIIEVRLFVSSTFRLQMTMISRIRGYYKLLSENLNENQHHSRYSILSKIC